jgi:CRP-like cAMP-binding protein
MTNPLITKLEGVASLSGEERRVLAEAALRTRTLGPDQDVVREGEATSECHLILDGVLCRYKLLPEGRRQIIGFQIPGDLCDLTGFVLGRMDHSVATLTETKLAVISHKRIQDITEQYPHLARALWQETIIDASISREWLANIGRRSAYQRIAHLLCEMGSRLEAVGRAQNGTFEWPITQAEVADAMGLSHVHVNRVLKQLRAEALIELKERAVVVRDWERLQKIGEFRPDYLFLPPKAGNQGSHQPIA